MTINLQPQNTPSGDLHRPPAYDTCQTVSKPHPPKPNPLSPIYANQPHLTCPRPTQPSPTAASCPARCQNKHQQDNMIQHTITPFFPPFQPPPQSSSFGILIHASIAALKAANPAHPTAAACGPPLRARIAPVRQPAATP